jgi:hypothetical protein
VLLKFTSPEAEIPHLVTQPRFAYLFKITLQDGDGGNAPGVLRRLVLHRILICRELYGTDEHRTEHQDIHPAHSSYKEAVVDLIASILVVGKEVQSVCESSLEEHICHQK